MNDSGQPHEYEWSLPLQRFDVEPGYLYHLDHAAIDFSISGASHEGYHSDPGAPVANESNSDAAQSIDTHVSGQSREASNQHFWVQINAVTTTKELNHLITTTSNDSGKYFVCGWSGCGHQAGFTQKTQLVTHIRSVHLHEKPFNCTTCGQYFSRKQDAIRHVNTFNGGKKYKCSACQRAFSRKSYRDNHEELCLLERFFPAAHPYH